MARVDPDSPQYKNEWLWTWIRDYGGLHRDRERWDSHLTARENRRMFRFLDRANGKGIYLDRLGQEIGCMFPEYQIENGDDLWGWLQRTRSPSGRARA